MTEPVAGKIAGAAARLLGRRFPSSRAAFLRIYMKHVDDLTAEIAALKAENDRLAAQDGAKTLEIDALKARIAALRGQILTESAENAALRSRNARESAEIAALRRMAREGCENGND